MAAPTGVRFSFVVEYDEALVRAAVRRFMWRRMLGRAWLWLSAAGLSLAGAVLGWAEGPSFGAGLGVAGLASLVGLVAAVWRAHLVASLGRLRAMAPRSAAVTLDEAGLTVASSLGSSTLFWPRFQEAWRLERSWVLFLGPSQFMTLPTAGLPADAEAFLRSRLPPVA